MAENIEVYRKEPIVGKLYYHAEYDYSVGKYPNTQYYVDKSKLKFVGQYVKHMTYGGFGDGARHHAHFLLDGKEVIINYSYEGRTCFLEYNE